MLRELLSIFRSDNPLHAMGESFSRMLKLTFDMTIEAGEIFFGRKAAPESRTQIYRQDVQVNQLERAIRKQVATHLSMEGNSPDVPYCLLLMSLVKDVERIGDYAKNLSEVEDIRPESLPEDELFGELQEIRHGVEAAFHVAADIFSTSDRERALPLIRQGKDLAHRCDTLVGRIAASSHDSSATTALVLGTRYYKRIGGHLLNVLSSVVMPLHKVDYYDEDEIKGNTPNTG